MVVKIIRRLIFFTPAIILFFLWLNSTRPLLQSDMIALIGSNDGSRCWKRLVRTFDDYMICVKRETSAIAVDQLYDTFPDILKNCHRLVNSGSTDPFVNVTYFKATHLNEPKAAILNDQFTDASSCSVVTLGIGHTVGAELSIKQRLPWCKFYGADPGKTNAEIFRRVGTFFEMAVGHVSGVHKAFVMEQNYKPTDVRTVDLVTFLSQHAKLQVVDMLLMDIEGGEYDLVPFFYRNGQLDKAGITVCQINMEFHAASKKNNITLKMFADTLTAFHANSDYVPITVVPYRFSLKVQHLYTLLVNYGNPICVKKYLRPLCTGK